MTTDGQQNSEMFWAGLAKQLTTGLYQEKAGIRDVLKQIIRNTKPITIEVNQK